MNFIVIISLLVLSLGGCCSDLEDSEEYSGLIQLQTVKPSMFLFMIYLV